MWELFSSRYGLETYVTVQAINRREDQLKSEGTKYKINFVDC